MRTLSICIIFSLMLFSASCSNEQTEQTGLQPTAEVNISVTDFAMTLDSFPSGATTRATDVSGYTDLKVLTLAFYSGSTKVYESTQLREDASTYTTFGQFSCHLPLGSYKLVVIGRALSAGDAFTLTSATEAAYTSDRVRETFSASQDVTVSSTAAQNLNVTLSRIVAMLRIASTDVRTAEATQIRTTYSAGGKGFNPTTGLATTNTGFQVVNHPSTVGEPPFMFLAMCSSVPMYRP